MRILGISCFYHDSAACLVQDGRIIAAAQEERFTRQKHDASFPRHAIEYCIAEGAGDSRVDAVVLYDKPLLKFHRILETYLSIAPNGFRPFLQAIPLWLRERLWIEPTVWGELDTLGITRPNEIHFAEHHESHAASAFFPSPFHSAAVLTIDGVGEWATASVGIGDGKRLEILEELHFPHSLGLLYSAFTYFAGFRVNSGEYKLMGLAPYGEGKYTNIILNELMDLKPDGSFRLDMRYFGYLDSLVMTNERFAQLFGGPPRSPEAPITRREMDLARSVQEVTEMVVLRMARHARKLTGLSKLCMAGGVALNCVANGRLLREGVFDDLWIQPAAGDCGGALGAALALWHGRFGQERAADGRTDAMQGALLGPEFSAEQIGAYLDRMGYAYERIPDEEWPRRIAELIAQQSVVAVFQGRMEFGPRALGNRSILGDPRSPQMQSIMNLKIKFRESFRPFAPSVLEERARDWFELDRPSPYMLLVAEVASSRRKPMVGDERALSLEQWVSRTRSDIPAVTHVDYSARVQTVSRRTNPRYHALLSAFEELTGCSVLINTSFNVRGEPIVATPEDAYRCFMGTQIDYLSLGPYLLRKIEQPAWPEASRANVSLD